MTGTKPWLDEAFGGAALDPRLTWHCPPPSWRLGPGGLCLSTAAGTDFWQGTHYGFRVDNGHALLAAVDGDFVMETRVGVAPRHQYDQAGLMVRLDAGCWLKTSVEHEPGEPSRLGAVITNHGWSDWSTQDLEPTQARDMSFRVTRRGSDYLVEAAIAGSTWSQIRLGRLQADRGGPVHAGIYACSPKAAGLEARFARLTITALARGRTP
jgi:regulation of enolase protein 1 (concanavalin A-like superfamily)